MDETNKVSKIVIKKLKSKYKNYSDLIKNIEIIRYESDQHAGYYYDDAIFTIGNVKCFIDRYLEDEKVEIKYSFCIITPFSLKIGTLNYLVFSSYLFIKSLACINK
jgi:hypothetical protein